MGVGTEMEVEMRLEREGPLRKGTSSLFERRFVPAAW